MNTGYYTKIGRIVHAIGFFQISAINSPVGTLQISLPFTCANESENGGDCAAFISMNGLVSNNVSDVWGYVGTNAAIMTVYMADATSIVGDAAEQCDTGTDMRINVTYMV